jgi:hypothetical protein
VLSPAGLSNWGVFTATYNAPLNTTLTFEVLDPNNGDALITSVVSGDNLDTEGVDAATYPQIKLRANFSTTDGIQTPTLSDWTVTYQE